jgi:uncharacterized protein
MRCSVRDLTTLSKREITPRGYLSAPAVIGRCGVQVYGRSELGLDGDPQAPVRLMRLPEEVFRPETVASFENVPITDDHPDRGVDASNWRDLAKGEVRDIGKHDGNLLGGVALVKDGGLVAKVVGGKAALSCGYSFDLDLTPGMGPDGQPFDGYQRNILGDHVAIVDSPRGGPICRISDTEQKGKTTMAMRKLAVDGLPRFEIDELAAESIEKEFAKVTKDRDKVIEDFDTYADEAKAKLKAADAKAADAASKLAAKDTEIADLKAKLTKAQSIDVDALVAERAQVVADAKKLAPSLEAKGSSHQLRLAAIAVACADETNKKVADAILGSDHGKATEAQVKGAFEVLLSLPKQAALAAQDEALRGLVAGDSNTITGPIERIGGGDAFKSE